MVNQASAASVSRSDGRLSEPMALIVAGAAIGLVAILVAAIADGNALGAVVAAVAGVIGSTLWLVGAVAMGVRIGRR